MRRPITVYANCPTCDELVEPGDTVIMLPDELDLPAWICDQCAPYYRTALDELLDDDAP